MGNEKVLGKADPLVVVTRKLPEPVEARMRELFDTRFNETDKPLTHAELVEAQLARTPQGAPTLAITRRPDSIFGYAIDDFNVQDYHPQGHLSAPVAV